MTSLIPFLLRSKVFFPSQWNFSPPPRVAYRPVLFSFLGCFLGFFPCAIFFSFSRTHAWCVFFLLIETANIPCSLNRDPPLFPFFFTPHLHRKIFPPTGLSKFFSFPPKYKFKPPPLWDRRRALPNLLSRLPLLCRVRKSLFPPRRQGKAFSPLHSSNKVAFFFFFFSSPRWIHPFSRGPPFFLLGLSPFLEEWSGILHRVVEGFFPPLLDLPFFLVLCHWCRILFPLWRAEKNELPSARIYFRWVFFPPPFQSADFFSSLCIFPSFPITLIPQGNRITMFGPLSNAFFVLFCSPSMKGMLLYFG